MIKALNVHRENLRNERNFEKKTTKGNCNCSVASKSNCVYISLTKPDCYLLTTHVQEQFSLIILNYNLEAL